PTSDLGPVTKQTVRCAGPAWPSLIGVRYVRSSWTCPSGCGDEGPSALSLALDDRLRKIASDSLRAYGPGPYLAASCQEGRPSALATQLDNLLCYRPLGQEVPHHVPMDVGQPEVPPLEA